MSLECPMGGTFECWCVNKYSKAWTDKLAPSDCMGKPSANHLNGGQNDHCRGPYAFGDFWGGGWHRGMLYGVEGVCKSVALGSSDSGLAQCFDSFGDGCYCTPTPPDEVPPLYTYIPYPHDACARPW